MEGSSVADMLAREAERAEQLEAEHRGPYVRARRPTKDPSQIYSLRIPLSRLEAVRELADENHTTPAALLRCWVLERLDEETRQAPAPDLSRAQRDEVLALARKIEAAVSKVRAVRNSASKRRSA